MILAAAGIFLLSPPAPPSQTRIGCCSNMRITRSLGFPWNSDSHVFVGIASRPDAMCDTGGAGGLWQSRPLFVLLGALARSWWKTAFDLAGFHPRLATEDVPGWLGFVLLNLATLTVALRLFVSLFARLSTPPPVLLLLASFLAWNQVVKVFFWNAHTQMFNVLVPVLAIGWCADALAGTVSGRRQSGRMLLSGVMMLAYGSFLIAAVASAAGEAIRSARQRAPLARVLARLAACAALVAAGPVLWFTGVRLATGRAYSREAERYHEFVWVSEAIRDHRLGRSAVENAGKFLASIPAEVGIGFCVLAVLLLVARFGAPPGREWSREAIVLAEASLVALGLAGAFFAFMGFYAIRLTWNLFPPILVLVAIAVGEACGSGSLSRRAAAWGSAGLAAGNAIFWVVHPGPWC